MHLKKSRGLFHLSTIACSIMDSDFWVYILKQNCTINIIYVIFILPKYTTLICPSGTDIQVYFILFFFFVW